MLTASYCSQCWGNNVLCGIKTRGCHDSFPCSLLELSSHCLPEKINCVSSKESVISVVVSLAGCFGLLMATEHLCGCGTPPLRSAAVLGESQSICGVHLPALAHSLKCPLRSSGTQSRWHFAFPMDKSLFYDSSAWLLFCCFWETEILERILKQSNHHSLQISFGH